MAEDHDYLGKLPKVKKAGKILHYKDPKTGVVHAVSRGKKKKSVMVTRKVDSKWDDGTEYKGTERVKKKLKKKDPYRTEQRRQTKDYEALKKLREVQKIGEEPLTDLGSERHEARKVIARRGKKKTFKEGQAKFRQGRRTK